MTIKDFEHLAYWLKRSREELGRPQAAAAEDGPSERTVQLWEAGTLTRVTGPLRRYVIDFLGWTPDSLDRVLAGGEPDRGDPLAGMNSPYTAAELAALEAIAAGRPAYPHQATIKSLYAKLSAKTRPNG